jgi:hypothetical protein
MSTVSLSSLSSIFANTGTASTNKSKSDDLLQSLFNIKPTAKNPPKSVSTSDDTTQLAAFGLGELESLAKSAQAFRFEATQSSFSASGDNFQAAGLRQSARFEATFQNDDQTLKLTLEVERTVVGVAYQAARQTNDPLADVFGKLFDDLQQPSDNANAPTSNGDSPSTAADWLTKLIQGQSPPFNFDQNDNPPQSAAENDFIKRLQQAIDDGFQRAQDQLGPLSESIQDAIRQTRQLLGQNLDGLLGTNGADQTLAAEPSAPAAAAS